MSDITDQELERLTALVLSLDTMICDGGDPESDARNVVKNLYPAVLAGPVEGNLLRNAIASVLVAARHYPERVSTRILGQDMTVLIDKTTDAVKEALIGTSPTSLAPHAHLCAWCHCKAVGTALHNDMRRYRTCGQDGHGLGGSYSDGGV